MRTFKEFMEFILEFGGQPSFGEREILGVLDWQFIPQFPVSKILIAIAIPGYPMVSATTMHAIGISMAFYHSSILDWHIHCRCGLVRAFGCHGTFGWDLQSNSHKNRVSVTKTTTYWSRLPVCYKYTCTLVYVLEYVLEYWSRCGVRFQVIYPLRTVL